MSEATIDAILGTVGPALLVTELRHLGGAARRPAADPGAVSVLDVDYLILTGGVAIDPETTAATHRAVDELLAALAPWRPAFDYLNFRSAAVPGEQLWGADTYRSLQAVKAKYDPANLVQANHEIAPG